MTTETFITNILPIVVAVLNLGAGIIMCCYGKWGSATYWLSACTITIGVIMIPHWG